jgi:hypothetical protein
MFNKKKNNQSSTVDTSTKTAVSDNASTSVIGNGAFGGPGTVLSFGNMGKKAQVKITNYFPPEVQALFQNELESSERQLAAVSAKFGEASQQQLSAFETLAKNTTDAVLSAKQESRSLISAVIPVGIVVAVLGAIYLITKKG